MDTQHSQALARAKESRAKLIAHLETITNDDAIYPLLFRAIVDAKIEGTLVGIDMVKDKVELEAYTRGYTEGLNDQK